MFRYFALAWNYKSTSASAEACALIDRVKTLYPDLTQHWITDGLSVHWDTGGSKAYRGLTIGDGAGLILGTVFTRPGECSSSSKQADQSDVRRATNRIMTSSGAYVLEAFWGRFVAFIRDPIRMAVHVLNDPTAAMPCFQAPTGQVQVFFSFANDYAALGLPATLERDFVAAYAASSTNERLGVTGFKEIALVHGGERVTLCLGETTRSELWNPYQISMTSPIYDLDEAVMELRSTVLDCVQAWAKIYNGVLHRLSGGIDSSIIASCLSDIRGESRITCYTHHSPGPESDERVFARAVAKRSNLPLIEYERKCQVRLDSILDCLRNPTPYSGRYGLEYNQVEARLARDFGADVLFSGECGDVLFYTSVDKQAALDAAWLRGLSSASLRACLDASRREGMLFWDVLGTSIKAALRRTSPPDPWPAALRHQRAILGPDAMAMAVHGHQFEHPWRRHNNGGFPPGKYSQIYDLLLHDYQPFYGSYSAEGDPDEVAPLYSLPIIELCLRIPTFVHSTGGWDRAVARRAFLKDVPREVITRRTKGANDAHLKEILFSNIAFLRETLLDGYLCSEKIVPRTDLEKAMSRDHSNMTLLLSELYWYLSIEAWISRWRR